MEFAEISSPTSMVFGKITDRMASKVSEMNELGS